MEPIKSSELIINPDGSVFHLHLRPEHLADTIILVGDPGRVELVASFFDNVELTISNREFVTKTGTYNGKRFSVVSTGIGTDNIDIVINELDAVVNIDLKTRIPKKEHKSLTIVRIGTSGSLQGDIPVDSFLLSKKSIGFDGMLNFYAGRDEVSDLEFEKAFKEAVNWNPKLASPYFVSSSEELINRIDGDNMIQGITISANGFYGPQGRVLRLKTLDMDLNDKLEAFEYKGQKITNYEMESSAIAGLSALLGHKAATVCAIIANRVNKDASKDYKPVIKNLIKTILDRLSK
ncbi:nucleoside phosphorylase [Ancylomarina sp. 16SWW S1-10-2]|uniref:nucleoside phosphorylase n=1 Tax=Ancylomarina sp. 16SWW S1-10-2 TaxID=2499681 RepID=UPI0012AD5797|nr:nucleoside phosphorylase [Ancylomarina sp. 16SWW S1-10-2]MRT94087.1 phosphorylase [Ancylomarina sp. 16SWW S1-10-2]